jgi:hypothetical protein
MSESSVNLARIQKIEELIISSIETAASCMDRLSGGLASTGEASTSSDEAIKHGDEFMEKIKAAKALVQAALSESSLTNKTFEASTYSLRASHLAQEEKIRALQYELDELKS